MSGRRLVRIEAAATRPLRHAVLRPTMTLADCEYAFDEDPLTLHVGILAGGSLVGVGSILPDPHASEPVPGAWRIRGMAVVESLRGAGLGGAILGALLAHPARAREPRYVWCSGRVTALAFYRRHGFHQVGEIYDQPPLGPHAVMRREVAPTDGDLAPEPPARSCGPAPAREGGLSPWSAPGGCR